MASKINETLIEKYKNDKLIIKTYYKDSNGIVIDGIVNPLKIDNRQLMSPTDNQGNIPGCAGWSACTLAESLYWKQTGKIIQLNGEQVYAKAKTIDGMRNIEGTTLEASLEAAISLCAFEKQYKIGTFQNTKTTKTIDTVKFLIHKYNFIQAGFMIDNAWYNCTKDDYVLKQGSRSCGGHAVNIVGYDETGFYVLNQWGKNFGAKGYCIIPYDLFLKELMYVAYVYDNNVTVCAKNENQTDDIIELKEETCKISLTDDQKNIITQLIKKMIKFLYEKFLNK